MGNRSSVFPRIRGPQQKPLGLLLVGMYGTGKSTIQRKLSNKVDIAVPRVGFNVQKSKGRGFIITLWEYGGRGFSRQVWKLVVEKIDAIVFVVDSADNWEPNEDQASTTQSFSYYRDEQSRDELKRLLREELLQGLPLLVLCNKQDHPNAKSPQEITKFLQLESIDDRPWTVRGCVATSGEGLNEGYKWLEEKVRGYDDKSDGTASSSGVSNVGEPVPEGNKPSEQRVVKSDRPPEESLTESFGYDPMEKGTNTTLGRFRPIQQGSECPFAKSAKLWGGKVLDGTTLEEQAKANVEALTEFTRRSNAGDNLDGFCIELDDPQARDKTPEDLGHAVRRMLTALSNLDPEGEAVMSVKYVGARGWRFRFAKADFFVTTFAPCYPVTSSRYAFGCKRAFVLLQPELSFLRHKLPLDTPHTNWEAPKTVRDKARVAFRDAGRGYYIPNTTKYPPAEHIVKPLQDVRGSVIHWWETVANASTHKVAVH